MGSGKCGGSQGRAPDRHSKMFVDEWVDISPDMLLGVFASLDANQKEAREASFHVKHKQEMDESFD